jgi:AcrR family transcriptional regulator
MTRLARDRETHLTEEEIAAETLRCFDTSASAPSIRQLAMALKVTPSAIYHHYPSRAAIVQAAVNLVWEEATVKLLELIPDPFSADPVEVLVTSGLATRRAFGEHFRIAPFMAATPQADRHLVAIMVLMTNVFERLGLDADDAAASFHSYASFTIGSTLFAATRHITNEAADAEKSGDAPAERFRSARTPGSDGGSGSGGTGSGVDVIHHALDEMMDVSVTDPKRDEELFVQGLRRLIAGFTPEGSR